MNLIQKTAYIFFIVLLLLMLVGAYNRPWTIGLFVLSSTALLVYQVIIILKDTSTEAADPIEPN